MRWKGTLARKHALLLLVAIDVAIRDEVNRTRDIDDGSREAEPGMHRMPSVSPSSRRLARLRVAVLLHGLRPS
jgi:hypothetical protein